MKEWGWGWRVAVIFNLAGQLLLGHSMRVPAETAFFEQLSFEPGDDDSHFIKPEDVAEAVSFVLNSRTHIVVDEINLSPLNKIVKFKKS